MNEVSGQAVAAVVISYNSATVLPDCLASVLSAQADGSVSDIIVVDNGSQDDSVAVADSYPGVRVLKTGVNGGYAAAINAGIADLFTRSPGPDAVLVLNPDVRLQPGAVAALFEGLGRPGCGISVPRLVDEVGRIQYSLRRRPSLATACGEAALGGLRSGPFSEVIIDPATYERPGPVVWATGAAMMLGAATIHSVGEWDESFFLYSEETEYCLRAADRGWTTRYEPSAVVAHIGGESTTNERLWSLLVVNRVKLYSRRHGLIASTAYFAVTLAGQVVRAAVGRRTCRAATAALVRAGRSRVMGS